MRAVAYITDCGQRPSGPFRRRFWPWPAGDRRARGVPGCSYWCCHRAEPRVRSGFLMAIWRDSLPLELVKQHSQNTLITQLGIEFIEAGDDYLTARMPVD